MLRAEELCRATFSHLSPSSHPLGRGRAGPALSPPPAELPPARRQPARCVARNARLSAVTVTYPEGRHRRFLPAASVPLRAARITAAALLPKPVACRRQEGGTARPQQAAEKRQHPHRPSRANDGPRHSAPGSGAHSLPGRRPPPLP